jgi:hypothetical protein
MNHGTVRTEIAEFSDSTQRVVLCELVDGWHVVEAYRPGQKTDRVVVETLTEARRAMRLATEGR